MTELPLSILIPVYNTENYLSRCLDSVFNQTLQQIEIIIVNDGSTDSSQAILEEYVARDSRITVVVQTNQGLGPTRNAGLELAHGDYIAFLDSDDWVEPDYYQTLYEAAVARDVDIVISDHSVDFPESVPECSRIIRNDINMQKEEYLLGLLGGKIPGFSVNKLYRRTLLEQYGLRFPTREVMDSGQDQYYSVRSVFFARSIAFVPHAGYHYFVHQASIVQKYQRSLLHDRFALYQQDIDFLQLHQAHAVYYNAINLRVLSDMYRCLCNECKVSNTNSFIQCMITYHSIRTNTVFLDCYNRPDIRMQLPFLKRLGLSCLRYHLYPIAYLLVWVHYRHITRNLTS